ncbi:Protein of uncharacterised function (DUF3125) [Staphylococcus aureus]|nr:Protein of uncharacterised function (DUF3125) [Staphylococcus aureus]
MIFSQNLFRRPTPARLTRIEKSLLQAHFRSVNYCQYNFVEHRTLIYVQACIIIYIFEIKKTGTYREFPDIFQSKSYLYNYWLAMHKWLMQ